MADINAEVGASNRGEASRKDDLQANPYTNTQDSDSMYDCVNTNDSHPSKDRSDPENTDVQDSTSTNNDAPVKNNTSTAGDFSESSKEYNLRVYNLSYATAQIDVATNALDQAYKALCEVDRHVLLSRPPESDDEGN